MKAISSDIEFRGSEDKTFKSDDGKNIAMKVFRFEDETGMQNEFYVMADKLNDVEIELYAKEKDDKTNYRNNR